MVFSFKGSKKRGGRRVLTKLRQDLVDAKQPEQDPAQHGHDRERFPAAYPQKPNTRKARSKRTDKTRVSASESVEIDGIGPRPINPGDRPASRKDRSDGTIGGNRTRC